MRAVAGACTASVYGIRRLGDGIYATRIFFGIRNQINAAASEGMATPKPLEGKPRSMTRTVELHGNGGILRTRRIELAGAGH